MNKLTALCASALLFFPLALQAQQAPIRLGQVVPLSGPLANVGKEINAATLAAFAQHNARSKPRIELLTQDDGNSPERSAAAVQVLSQNVSGFVSCFGTVGCLAQMKSAKEAGLPLIAPISGAPQLRDKAALAAGVYAIRASASEELARLLQYAQTIGITNFAVVVQNDGFGLAYNAALQPLLAQYGIQVETVAMFNPQNPDYDAITRALQKPSVNALLLLANATHSIGVMKSWRSKSGLPFVFNLAGQANAAFVKGFKGQTVAAGFVTVTPSPWGTRSLLQREYQAAMTDAGIDSYSYLSFEAYINAKVAIEAIKLANKGNIGSALKAAAGRGNISVGGLEWPLGEERKNFTDLSALTNDGLFKH